MEEIINENIFGDILKEAVSIVDEDSPDKEFELGLSVIGSFLSLPDDLFDVISETFLSKLEQDIKDPKNKAQVLASIQSQSFSFDEYYSLMQQVIEEVDKELSELPQNKRDFLKRIVLLEANVISEEINKNKYISIPIELCHPDAKIPTYANSSDAGMDIYALEDIEVLPGETKLVKTGLKVAIPAGYELQVRPKSGRALKTKLRVANTPGTIDSGYRDEIGVIIENIEPPIKDISYHMDLDENNKPIIEIKSIVHGKPYTIEKGQKFAQLVLNQVPRAAFVEVKDIKEIEGDRQGGFGSTGLK